MRPTFRLLADYVYVVTIIPAACIILRQPPWCLTTSHTGASLKTKDLYCYHAQKLCLVMAIRRNFSHVQSYCALATGSSQASIPQTNIFLGTTLNCTDVSGTVAAQGAPYAILAFHNNARRAPPSDATLGDTNSSSSVQNDVRLNYYCECCPDLYTIAASARPPSRSRVHVFI